MTGLTELALCVVRSAVSIRQIGAPPLSGVSPRLSRPVARRSAELRSQGKRARHTVDGKWNKHEDQDRLDHVHQQSLADALEVRETAEQVAKSRFFP